MIITENRLDAWVRENARDAQGTIVELVYRLVWVSCPKPKERRFPLGDSIGQSGPDGVLDTEVRFEQFVPKGRSYWEIGTGNNPRKKANDEYKRLTEDVPREKREEAAFIFVSPLSAARSWPYSSQEEWVESKRKLSEWRDINVIDGTILVDWMKKWPAVESWMAKQMGMRVEHVESPRQRWQLIRTYGEPPPLTPQIFLANRSVILPKLEEVFNDSRLRLKLQSHFRGQTADFVSAWIETLDPDTRTEYDGRCLIVSTSDLRDVIDSLQERHVLVANMHFEDLEDEGAELMQQVHHRGHALIFGGAPGGRPDPNAVTLPNPKSHDIREALQQAGYPEERARIVAQKCDGNLRSLVLLLQNLSDMPEWAQKTGAADLAIAQFLGSWREDTESDCSTVEAISGKAYGEWIRGLRTIVTSPDTPLIHHNGIWKVTSRYDVWHHIGTRIYDNDLDRFRSTCTTVLREIDPQFDLAPDERYAASIHGKVLKHSKELRKGLAETLALLGSYPRALSSCSVGKPESIATLAVRELLCNADWLTWASLNDLLPLLAEASPGEFLNAVEAALLLNPSPYEMVFRQEGNSVFGWNYMTGILWALETLAWDSDYLPSVVILLGQLALKDPGGKWANRPINSLSTILLPWYPQTCASIQIRIAAVEALQREVPEIAWKLLLALLPGSHQTTMGTRRPEWRETILDDFSVGTTDIDYWRQIIKYAKLALLAAESHTARLIDLIERLEDLPDPIRDQLLSHLNSEAVTSMPEAERVKVWNAISSLISKHKKFSDAQWAMDIERLNRVSTIADAIAPKSLFYMHQRLFTDDYFNLIEERGNFEEQARKLEERREEALSQIFEEGGMPIILEFARVVDSSWRVGYALGVINPGGAECGILPILLESLDKHLSLFAGGFVQGRFQKERWDWVDRIDTANWSPSQKGNLLAYLPFTQQTWDRATRLLGQDEAPYWSRTTANAHEAEDSISYGIDRLVKYGRPFAAAQCLAIMLFRKEPLDWQQSINVLDAGTHSAEPLQTLDVHSILEVIAALQAYPEGNPDDLMRVEWPYLPLLDEDQGASPKFLEQRLAEDPAFFCEIIQMVVKPKNETGPEVSVSEEQKARARNAYDLLNKWKTPPGTLRDGTFDGEALNNWIIRAREICAQSGHLKIAEQRIGHVLIHAPSDPNGLWLHRSVAEALNAKGVDDMRLGFRSELFNSRGTFACSAGREERALASSYRDRAKQLDEHGLLRLAQTIRELADEYDRMAEREAAADELEDI